MKRGRIFYLSTFDSKLELFQCSFPPLPTSHLVALRQSIKIAFLRSHMLLFVDFIFDVREVVVERWWCRYRVSRMRVPSKELEYAGLMHTQYSMPERPSRPRDLATLLSNL